MRTKQKEKKLGDIIHLFECDCGDQAEFVLYDGYGVRTRKPRQKCRKCLSNMLDGLLKAGVEFSVRKLPKAR